MVVTMVIRHMNSQYKNTLIASIGASMEYYDFVIYALLATYLGKYFFPHNNPTIALLETFGVFAVGYLTRPVGGMIFGSIGDRIGRKATLIVVMLLMAMSTFTMGLLPAYSKLGLLAPVFLILLRMIQGISFGAEIPGAITFIIEHADAKHRGLHAGLMTASISLGAMLGSLIIYVLNHWLSTASMLEWGWRIPFLIGGILAVMVYMMRRKAQETPLFETLSSDEKETLPLRTVFRDHKRTLAQGFGITIFPTCFIVFGLFLPSYYHTYFQYNLSSIYLIMMIGLLWSAILLPFFGKWSDSIGRPRLLFFTTILFICLSFPLFHLLSFRAFNTALTFMLVYQTFLAAIAACYFPLLAELFPTPVRYTGVAVCYNIVYSIAGCVPMLLSYLLRLVSNPEQIVWFYLALAAITALTSFLVKQKQPSMKAIINQDFKPITKMSE